MNPTLPPWANGPYELLKHADGHLKAGGDIDRRLALIGFDQTIEVCIDVFLRLHPRLRGGVQLEREEVDRASKNFHSKIEFLERHLLKQIAEHPIPFEAIVWYHSLRNELYHSGNGMVPERHVLEGAREASVRVFTAIFGDQYAGFVVDKEFTRRDPAETTVRAGVNPEMEFLEAYMSLERTARSIAGVDASKKASFHELWRSWGHIPQAAKWSDRILRLIAVRNAVVHGEGADKIREPELEEAALFAYEVAMWLEGLGPTELPRPQ